MALVGLSLHGATLTTTLAGAPDTPTRGVTIVGQRLDGVSAPVESTILVPGTTDLPLPEGLWEVRITDGAVWAAPVHLRNVDSANVRVWPTMPVQGTANGIAKLRAQFAPSDGDDGATGEIACEVAKDAWTCRLPAGRHDVRFSSPGMSPEFRSGISAESKGADLALRFVAGASLHGWVDAATPVEGAQVVLQGDGAQQVTPANAKGFFQFKGLAPGGYSVSARRKGLVAPGRSVKVLAGVAAELREPLHLDTPKQLTILVVPPLDPDGEMWRLRLTSAGSSEVIEERVPHIGQWSRDGLVAGSYNVQLLDAHGGRWRFETIAIGSDDRIVAMPASGTILSGRVTLGGRALGQARVSFGGEGGRVLQADDDGRFAGAIPLGDNDERLIFVEADTPYVRRSVRARIETDDSGEARLSLELPGTTLMGRVLNEDRSPAQAFLTVTGETDSETFEQAATESDGSFQVAGLDPGSYRVIAEASAQKSDLLRVNLVPNEPAEVEIILKHEEILRGKMTIGDTPVIAAKILAIPRDAAWSAVLPETTTNERGMFQLRLPPGTTIFDGLAVHPAFDTVIARGGVRPDKVVWVQATQIGGTLIVDSQEPHEVLLLHKGAELPVKTIAALSGGTVGAAQITLPRVEPGEYAVCSFDKTSCASGYLPPHGSLTLTTPQR
jgi:hypothetical protein